MTVQLDDRFVDLLRPFLKYAADSTITADARLRDLGLDSMREVELLFALEDNYGIVVPEEKLLDSTFETGGDLWSVVTELRAQDGGQPR